MDYLINNFDEHQILKLIELNENIKNMSFEDVEARWQILRDYGCTDDAICEIISSNPDYLDSDPTNVKSLITSLSVLKEDTRELIESNPWLLNKDAYDVRDYIEVLNEKGATYDEIVLSIKCGEF